jgi:hypothetical protein
LRQTFVEHYSAEVLSNLKGEQMDTTTATDLANSVFAQIQALINKGQAEVLTNSTSQNTNTSDSSSSGVPGTAENAFAQIQQSFATAQAQVLADLSGSAADTTTTSTAATTTDTSTAATTTDTSTATATTAATPSVDQQLIQAGQNQVTASLGNDSLTNPGSDTSSTNSSTSPVFEFVPATDSSSGSFGQVNAIIGGETTPLFTLGAAGPVSSDSQGANANPFLSYVEQQGGISNFIASLSSGTTSTI